MSSFTYFTSQANLRESKHYIAVALRPPDEFFTSLRDRDWALGGRRGRICDFLADVIMNPYVVVLLLFCEVKSFNWSFFV